MSKLSTGKNEIIDVGNGWKFKRIEDPKELNNYCYFCDFNEITPHLHHIIRKSDKGKDELNNKLPLCANHHELIHRRVYVLAFNPKQGFYYLVHRETRKVIPPSERQRDYKRKLPNTSINNNKNLIIKGDLDSQGVISINDFERIRRFKQRRILRNKRDD